MRLVAIPVLALATLTGCVSLHANVPEEIVRQHVAREEGITLPAMCSMGGQSYSEGASVCMTGRRMTCDPSGRWVKDGSCTGDLPSGE